MKFRKEQELFNKFIEAYDKSTNELKQLKFLKMIDVVLMVFVIIILCMVSVRP